MSHNTYKRYKIYPAPPPETGPSSQNAGTPSKYAGLREEAWEFKAMLRVRREELDATAAATRKTTAPIVKKRRTKPERLNREPSKLGLALKDWWAFQKANIKYYCCCWKDLRHGLLPTICCLRAEVDDGAYEPQRRGRAAHSEQ